MRILNQTELSLFESLCKSTQNQLLNLLPKYLEKKNYNNIIATSDYILAEGNIPIMLCCHLDTVFPRPPKDIYYDRYKNVIFSTTGLGADDRAGLYSILNIIKKGYRPHIAFLTDEEVGANGAYQLVTDYKEFPFKDLRYIIELDRMSDTDAVFYDCDNTQFIDYVEKFGFVFNHGSFSDISVICEYWKIAGVNLSIGYYNQHTTSEILKVGHMLNTIDKVITMLTQNIDSIPKFEFIPAATISYYHNWYKYCNNDWDRNHCYCCGLEQNNTDMVPVKMIDDTIKYFCIDCLMDNVKWCKICGEAYEPNESDKVGLCNDCRYEMLNEQYR